MRRAQRLPPRAGNTGVLDSSVLVLCDRQLAVSGVSVGSSSVRARLSKVCQKRGERWCRVPRWPLVVARDSCVVSRVSCGDPLPQGGEIRDFIMVYAKTDDTYSDSHTYHTLSQVDRRYKKVNSPLKTTGWIIMG